MKTIAIVLATGLLAACSSFGAGSSSPEERAARNRCEALRSYQPFYPNQCGELSGSAPNRYR
jgi:hypothetical protein